MTQSTCHPEKLAFTKISGLCQACYLRDWRKRNLEHSRKRDRERSKRYRKTERGSDITKKNSRLSYQRHRLKRIVYQKVKQYGLTEEQYWEMLKVRNGKCDICSVVVNQLSVDHDHETKVVRGMLCHQCNRGIGLFKDDTGRMREAIKYLNRYKNL